MTKLYLSHPFSVRHMGLSIAERLEAKLGIEIINPFYSEGHEWKDVEAFDRARANLPQFRVEQLKKHGPSYFKKIVESDLRLIRESDGVIALVPQVFTMGTPMEVWEAKAVSNRPVYSMVYRKAENHPWLQYASEKVIPIDFDNVAEKQGVPLDILDFEQWWQVGRPKAEES